ncbi:MAG: enoyl-CoA hydratase/isomerase family protein [Xanthomonadales bacterium]|nr:enoyl-CoA hydratase/isomerase family protein [Gammaproteobacteria bacterium]NNE06330.1 enoyl-CoA hydratase/isomerase family protein [Xanthomonadales bacterium]NNL95761.1 enoyl-CoA hydratase/isomerase family protein [Xanthomonadales bacterium]
MPFETIHYETEGALAWITLNRPEKLNAINAQMVNELNVALGLAEANAAVRVILLNGAGKAFSSGFDLEDGSDDDASIRAELENDFNIIMRFWNCPKPTIAAVHRYCLGSAMEMAVACDITLAEAGTRLGAPEVRFGSGIVAMILPWLSGPKKAKEWLLTGNDRISAEEAEAHGLINGIAPAGGLDEAAREMALQIASNDSLAVKLTKHAINRSYEIAGMGQALKDALEIDMDIETTETEESREFNRILKARGARAALQWRQSQDGGAQ